MNCRYAEIQDLLNNIRILCASDFISSVQRNIFLKPTLMHLYAYRDFQIKSTLFQSLRLFNEEQKCKIKLDNV